MHSHNNRCWLTNRGKKAKQNTNLNSKSLTQSFFFFLQFPNGLEIILTVSSDSEKACHFGQMV